MSSEAMIAMSALLQSLDAWLRISHRVQLTNADCVAGALWWFAAVIAFEIPRALRWLARILDELGIR